MSISFVGRERLSAILDETQRIIVSNRTSLENGLTIHGLALGLHSADGNVRFRKAGTPIEPDESLVLEDDPPLEEKIVAVEAFMRLSGESIKRIIDAYVKTELEGSGTSFGDIELGVTQAGGESVEQTTPLEEAPGFAVFARADT
jgi:hypothetical protein